jgi:quercetin dioxygenase-like cupin family protein
VKSLATNPTLTLPDGTSFEVVESDSENRDARIEFEFTMAPDAIAPPRHIHPSQQESWTVSSGELSEQVDDADPRSARATR